MREHDLINACLIIIALALMLLLFTEVMLYQG
jgi:hypothetical protein